MEDKSSINYRSNASKKNYKKRKRVARKIKLCLFYVCILLVIVSMGVLISFTALFKIESIEVSGKSRYDNNDIINVCGIKTGDNLFLCNAKNAQEAVQKNMPYIENVQISREIPTKIIIHVEESGVSSVVKSGNKYIALSSSGKILDVLDSNPAGAILLKGIRLSSAQVSSNLVFKDDSQKSLLNQINQSIEQNNFSGITEIDLTNMVNIALTYDNRIKVILGTSNDIDYKIRTAKSILINKIDKNESGTLDVSLSAENNHSYFNTSDKIIS